MVSCASLADCDSVSYGGGSPPKYVGSIDLLELAKEENLEEKLKELGDVSGDEL